MSDPVNAPKAGPVICVGGQGYGKHSLKQLLKKHADLERENAALRETVQELPSMTAHNAAQTELAALREEKARLVEALKLARTYVCWDDDSRDPSEYPEAEGIIKSHQQQIDAALAGKEGGK